MEHEVFVPVPAERLRAALADPARVARAVPGLQQDAGAAPGTGRLKVRVGSHSITYRGRVRVSAGQDGSYAVESDATEVRGTGSVKLALTVRVRDTDGGAAVTFEGTATADGRVAELPAETVAATGTRLLNRFTENLCADETETGADSDAGADAGAGARGEQPSVIETEASPESPTSPAEPIEPIEPTEAADSAGAGEAVDSAGSAEPAEPAESSESPESPEPSDESSESVEPFEGVESIGPVEPGEPAAEAAHARRTMIGRSAEEVDHAPPRGRYAPVPAPQTIAPNSTLRWAAPAAALVVASAIVVGRALRKRR